MVALSVLVSAVSLGLGLVRAPFVGVSCPRPNVTTCGRVGIAVWLAHPAQEVDATLGGHRVRLRLLNAPSGMWIGFVHFRRGALGIPAIWYGGSPVKRMTLHLRVRSSSGWRTGAVRIQLQPGWG
jgi:hypothetical protein